MDSFKELQQIYEGYRGHASQPAQQSYPATQGRHSYRGPLPGQTPGSAGPVAVSIPSDEEKRASLTAKEKDILKEIDILIKDAEKQPDKRTVFALSSIKASIENY